MDEEDRGFHDHSALDQLLNRYREVRGKIPTNIDLCLVSKFRSVWEIEILHRLTGHRYFGENYSQELISKAAVCPSDIKWAFIGHLQSNKVNTLIKSVPNLYVVETLDSETLASKLNDAVDKFWNNDKKLKVMIQVNISGETSKAGVPFRDEKSLSSLAEHVVLRCPHLSLIGCMGIAYPGDLPRAREEFARLRELGTRILSTLRTKLLSTLGSNHIISTLQFEMALSMGMTDDMEVAISEGSTEIRIGTAVFGPRQKSAIHTDSG